MDAPAASRFCKTRPAGASSVGAPRPHETPDSSRVDDNQNMGHEVPSLRTLFNLEEPKNAAHGLITGLRAAGQGILLGPAAAVVGPVTGAQAGGIAGCVKGLALGAVCVAALPIAGVSAGAAQIYKGLVSQSSAFVQTQREKRRWIRRCRDLEEAAGIKAKETGARGIKGRPPHPGSSPCRDDQHAAARSRDLLMGLPQDDSSPQMFTCPITLETLADPVVAADGFTYERAAIEAWMRSHSSSPMTGAGLPHMLLVPNNLVRAAISDWKQQQCPSVSAAAEEEAQEEEEEGAEKEGERKGKGATEVEGCSVSLAEGAEAQEEKGLMAREEEENVDALTVHVHAFEREPQLKLQ